jgi:hypothetical protein
MGPTFLRTFSILLVVFALLLGALFGHLVWTAGWEGAMQGNSIQLFLKLGAGALAVAVLGAVAHVAEKAVQGKTKKRL